MKGEFKIVCPVYNTTARLLPLFAFFLACFEKPYAFRDFQDLLRYHYYCNISPITGELNSSEQTIEGNLFFTRKSTQNKGRSCQKQQLRRREKQQIARSKIPSQSLIFSSLGLPPRFSCVPKFLVLAFY